jgi:predicted ribonuclease YlaK
MPGHLVIPDTNLLMEHPHTLDYIDWHETAGVHDLQGLTLVIPFMVIDELDNLKRSKGRSRARQTLKLLHPFVQSGLMGPHVLHQDEDRPVRLAFLSDPVGHRRLTRADEEIVERGGALQQLLDRRVTVVTYDTGMALRNHLGKQDVVHLEDS